jgi:hypothetical protein
MAFKGTQSSTPQREKAKKDGEFMGSNNLSTKEFLTSVEIVDKEHARLDPVTD